MLIITIWAQWRWREGKLRSVDYFFFFHTSSFACTNRCRDVNATIARCFIPLFRYLSCLYFVSLFLHFFYASFFYWRLFVLSNISVTAKFHPNSEVDLMQSNFIQCDSISFSSRFHANKKKNRNYAICVNEVRLRIVHHYYYPFKWNINRWWICWLPQASFYWNIEINVSEHQLRH